MISNFGAMGFDFGKYDCKIVQFGVKSKLWEKFLTFLNARATILTLIARDLIETLD